MPGIVAYKPVERRASSPLRAQLPLVTQFMVDLVDIFESRRIRHFIHDQWQAPFSVMWVLGEVSGDCVYIHLIVARLGKLGQAI